MANPVRDDSASRVAAVAPKAGRRALKGKPRGGETSLEIESMERQEEEHQRQMRALIALGRERGYLTHADINDHLADDFAHTAAMETIVSTFSDMGVAVYEQAPDAEMLLLSGAAPAALSDDQIRRTRKRKLPCRPSIPNSAARRIRSGCTCAKWAQRNC